MSQLFDITAPVTLHAAMQYPTGNKEVRAMTIAAFRCAQNSDELTGAAMDKALLKFLLADSTSALSHWKKKDRLVETDSGYSLTEEGLAECQNSLDGLVKGYSPEESQVRAWMNRMLNGDDMAVRQRQFDPAAFQQSEGSTSE